MIAIESHHRIARQRLLEVTLQRQRHDVRRTVEREEKLAAIGRLSATIAHEINNPLEAVTNLIYLAFEYLGIAAVLSWFIRRGSNDSP